MAQASYSFLDVAVLDEVRERFAAGDALVILSADLEEVIWANGPGAALFGHADVEAIIGAAAPLGAAAKRQIAATSGFPAIGRDRALLVRLATGMSSRAVPFLASAVRCRTARGDPAGAAGGRRRGAQRRARSPRGRSAASPRPGISWPSSTPTARSRRPPPAFARLGLAAGDAGGHGARGERRAADRQAHAAGPARPAAGRPGAADRRRGTCWS